MIYMKTCLRCGHEWTSKVQLGEDCPKCHDRIVEVRKWSDTDVDLDRCGWNG